MDLQNDIADFTSNVTKEVRQFIFGTSSKNTDVLADQFVCAKRNILNFFAANILPASHNV